MEPTAILVIICIAAGLFSAVMIPYLRKMAEIKKFKWRFILLAGIILVISLGFAQQLANTFIAGSGDNYIFLVIQAFMYGWGSQTIIVELGKVVKKLMEQFDISIINI